MNYKERYEYWLSSPCFDEATKAELRALSEDQKEIEERFYKELEFGTGGLRGILGAGENRMNIYTVRKATQGIANYIIKQGKQDRGVAVAHDSRIMSPEFADEVALCFAANGIKAYIFDDLRPTPELSFAVRHFNCIAGVNITASHNPANYNGYKAYWEDGAQVTPPHDTAIMAEVAAIPSYESLKTMDKAEAIEKGLYISIGKEVDDIYVSNVMKQVKNPDAIKKVGKEIKLVYTPLHGAGNVLVQRVLKELGFENVYVVPEQEKPDGNFPTVSYPNPESPAAFELALKLAKEKDADLVLATDPDADRLGVYVKDTKSGEYIPLNGNMSGSLLAEYTISQTERLYGLPKDGALIKTIVTTNLADAIAKAYGVQLYECLTGFKYIGQKILEFEQSGKGTYLFGFEESYGCLIGTHARDKDAVVAVVALCEAAAYYRLQGKTLWDVVLDMFEKYGYYKDGIVSVELKGLDGIRKIAEILNDLRENPPKEIAGRKVLEIRDYKKDTVVNLETGATGKTGLPESNVLYYDFGNGEWLCVRPSGTEPKLKMYFGVNGTSLEDADAKCEVFKKEAERMIGA